MSPDFNPLYSPYGAFELKATYQRNMLTSSLYVYGFVVFVTILGIILIKDPVKRVLPKFAEPRGSFNLEPPPSVAPSTPQIDIKPPPAEIPTFATLSPIDDEEFSEYELETEITTIDELYDGTGTEDGPAVESGESGNGISDGDSAMFGLYSFVYVEQRPEFVHRAIPVYPRLERQLGIEGIVWIAVEVDIDGSVTDAKVYKTSVRAGFDEAALAVAYDNKFRPAIQNGTPIKIWISYEVKFVLTN